MREHIESLRVQAVAAMTAIFTPLWLWVQAHWGGFWVSNPLVWLAIFWLADFCLGFGRAGWDGITHPADPERGIQPRKVLHSVLKLFGYVGGLMIAWGLRDALGIGGAAVATVAEVGILCYEASSVFRHLGALFPDVPVFNFIAQTARTVSGGKKDE